MNLYRSVGAPSKPRERQKHAFEKYADGFTFESAGRSGYIYYREDGKLAELYWEMPGLDDYDILLHLDGASDWVFPTTEKIAGEKRRTIIDTLEAWLIGKKIRSDAFGPIKREHFRKK
jgi:hypothetical protein